MEVNGKEMTTKDFAKNYIPTPEEFSIHNTIKIYFELEDIKYVLYEYFSCATIDDLSEEELNAIFDRQEDYLEEHSYESNILAEIIEEVLDEYGNTTIQR